ncbi:MAG: redox-regulated ATPase YchF [Candidatus Krumholzibacteriia bacterium]
MGLSVGIAGLPNVGKSTLLNALTNAGAEASNYPFCTIEKNVGIAAVPDPNLERLQEILSPEEAIPAAVSFVDIAGLIEGASKGEGLGNKFLGHIREADAILHVVRCFDDPNVPHPPGPPDPVRDVAIVETEFLLADLETAERAAGRWSKATKGGTGTGKEEAAAFRRAVDALSEGSPVSTLDLSDKEREVLAEARFLTAKPCLYVANTGEEDPTGDGPLARALVQAKGRDRVVPVSVQIEAEISELPSQEQTTYLRELGLEETALGLVLSACYRLLDQITFYTIAHDKLRAWSLPRGSTAQEAAGRIHTDMESGFIRAEVMTLDDLVEWGSRQSLHDHGLIHIVGRDHEVRDRDVLQIHFKP